MPTYEYACDCGHSWEEDQRIVDPPTEKCPKCGQDHAKRVIGKPTFMLKGGGWADEGYSNKT
jgi:putative FmdB family regulatory protein